MTIMAHRGGCARTHYPVIDLHPLSTRLKRARRVAKLTQPQLAKLLGVNIKTVVRLEAGRFPTQKSTQRLIEMWVLRNESRAEIELGEL